MAVSRPVSDEHKKRIFQQLKEKLEMEEEDRKSFGWFLRKHNCYDKFGKSFELDIDHSIIVGHIAKDICYHSDRKVQGSNFSEDSKLLSDFLTYLLGHRHSLFSSGMA